LVGIDPAGVWGQRLTDRRGHVRLDREGWGIRLKKVCRICKGLGMSPRHKMPKRRVTAKRRDACVEAGGPDEVRAMDVVHDQPATGRMVRVLIVVDTVLRCGPVHDSCRRAEGGAALDRACRAAGCRTMVDIDQGRACVSHPGKPADTAVIAAFNGGFRTGCQTQPPFAPLADAAEKVRPGGETKDRPQGAIGTRVPILRTTSGGTTRPSP
jgi:putative transposase